MMKIFTVAISWYTLAALAAHTFSSLHIESLYSGFSDNNMECIVELLSSSFFPCFFLVVAAQKYYYTHTEWPLVIFMCSWLTVQCYFSLFVLSHRVKPHNIHRPVWYKLRNVMKKYTHLVNKFISNVMNFNGFFPLLLAIAPFALLHIPPPIPSLVNSSK